MNQEEKMLLHKERYKETIKNLTVMSDILARNVFKDKNACESMSLELFWKTKS